MIDASFSGFRLQQSVVVPGTQPLATAERLKELMQTAPGPLAPSDFSDGWSFVSGNPLARLLVAITGSIDFEHDRVNFSIVGKKFVIRQIILVLIFSAVCCYAVFLLTFYVVIPLIDAETGGAPTRLYTWAVQNLNPQGQLPLVDMFAETTIRGIYALFATFIAAIYAIFGMVHMVMEGRSNSEQFARRISSWLSDREQDLRQLEISQRGHS
ncbi:MAG TPA: hypothetical protein VGM83_22140 [Devosiaceae bacterium]|jgi:hypothetical protein